MPHTISLTDFIEIVHKTGTARATMARSLLERDDYQPYQDYYKQLRERIVETHHNNNSKSYLKNILTSTPDFKQDNYKTITDKYCSWWGYKDLAWFNPPKGKYTYGKITVSINPELGLTFNNTNHVIKLYFKATKLSKQKADLALGLMEMSLNQSNVKLCILDIQSKKLFIPTINIPSLKQAVDGELSYLSVFVS